MKFGEREKRERKNCSDVSANRPGNRRRVKNKRFWYLEVARFLILYTGVKNWTSAIVEGGKMDFFPLGFNYVVNGLMMDCYVGPVGHKRWDSVTIRLDWKLSDGLGPYCVRALVSVMMSDITLQKKTWCQYEFVSRNTFLSFMKAVQSLAINFCLCLCTTHCTTYFWGGKFP